MVDSRFHLIYIMAKTKSTHVEQDETASRDKLATFLQKALNGRQKDGQKVAYFLDEKEDPSNVIDWVSTGCTMLDLAICNRPNAGLPAGRISEFNGLESSGKSLLCAHIIAETQKKGGFAVMLDPEYAAAPDFWTALGVSVKDLLYVPCSYLEEMLGHLEAIIGETRKENPDRLVTIITDSIASVPTKKELEADYDAAGYGTDKSKLLSLAMRKLNGLIARQRICAVFTNQLRQNLKAVSFGDPYLEPGGMAFRYAASVRVRTKNVGRVSNKEKEVIGRTIQTQVTKTRFGPSFRTASFDIHYDSGIQNLASWLDYMKDHGLITGTKAGYTFKMCDNQILNANEFVRVANEQPEFKEKVYKSICDNYIMVYRPANSKIDESVEHLEGDGKDQLPLG
jgi:recombination protein RecA